MSLEKPKARTEAAKRRGKAAKRALEAVCAVSGVRLSVSEQRGSTARSEAVADVIGPALARQCAICGLPDTEGNRKRVRNARHGSTLWGKLRIIERIDEDEFSAIAEADTLDNTYRRQLLDVPLAGPGGPGGFEMDADKRNALVTAWMRLQGVLGMMPPGQRAILLHVREAGPDVRPDTLDEIDAERLRRAARALGRHFGLRP